MNCLECGFPQDHHLHRPAAECDGCKAPGDHHAYKETPEEAAIGLLVDALERSQTALAQVFNWPENPDNAKLVAPAFEWNKLVLKSVKERKMT